MPAGAFTVGKLSRTPVWITLKTPRDCPAGKYRGTITLVPERLPATTVPLALTVWDFALTDQTHLRTMTWMSGGEIRAWYGHDWSAEGDRLHGQAMRNYQDFLLEHRLGPGGEISLDDKSLERLIAKGMNAFVMGTAPNLKREQKTTYSPEFVEQFTKNLRRRQEPPGKGLAGQGLCLRLRRGPPLRLAGGPEDRPGDPCGRSRGAHLAVPQRAGRRPRTDRLCRRVRRVRRAVPQGRRVGLAEKGAEVWLAICCYPMDHPNFFIEYPLLDLRVTPWICWKYKAAGFEYWSTTSWGRNWQRKGDKWPKVPWEANSFGRYNGDGHLIYPGADLRPYSSLRFEALRDGLEDYEYLWTLASLAEAGRGRRRRPAPRWTRPELLSLDGVVRESGTYAPQGEKYARLPPGTRPSHPGSPDPRSNTMSFPRPRLARSAGVCVALAFAAVGGLRRRRRATS